MIPDPILFGIMSAAIEEACSQPACRCHEEEYLDGEYDYNRDPEGLLLQYRQHPD
jgi:hypothetical protein